MKSESEYLLNTGASLKFSFRIHGFILLVSDSLLYSKLGSTNTREGTIKICSPDTEFILTGVNKN